MTTLLAVRLKRLLARRGWFSCGVCGHMVSPDTEQVHRLTVHGRATYEGTLPYPSVKVGREVA